ncbi:MAG TPA: signal peptidase II [Myxococcota bacterium]|nr:signal peptidase II [Myxococcota bacterium]HRY94823.1 signal peptidase II [Myxococcota bacterium]HSA21760.1 signal peptidase II [Myxococcota bacterium]
MTEHEAQADGAAQGAVIAAEDGAARAQRGRWLVHGAALLALSSTCVVLDQLTKWIALSALSPGRPAVLVPGFLSLELHLNPHGAFGLFSGLPQGLRLLVLVALSLVAITAVCVLVIRSLGLRPASSVALGLVLGGGLANLGDRVFRGGQVVDFILLQVDGLFRWPTFNLADAAITAGVALLAGLSIHGWYTKTRADNPETSQRREVP